MNGPAGALTVLSLCSGIGALDLGLQRAGMAIVGQVEKDSFCRRVLARNWPEVPRHDDVTTAPAWWTGHPRPSVDVVAAGFPCQPISTAGARRGTDDARWLWPQVYEVITTIRPPWVLLENVPGILSLRPDRGPGLGPDPDEPVVLGAVLGDLAAGGYDARWDCIPASAVDAPHQRDRWWCLAHLADAEGQRRRPEAGPALTGPGTPAAGVRAAQPGRRGALADPDRAGLDPWGWLGRPWPTPVRDGRWTPEPGLGGAANGPTGGVDPSRPVELWERGTPRVARGVPDQENRLRALGNAVVPQVAEHVARVLLDLAAATARGEAA